MKKFALFCTIALVALLVVPAYAEVQNVKVSGDLTARWLMRWNYDLDRDGANIGAVGLADSDAADDFLMTTAEVQVDADMTDNVSTVVRLTNQRNWGDIGGSLQGYSESQFNVIVDLASVTLKEMVYSPLTVTIGRQDLWFGKGFIVGAKQRDPKSDGGGALASHIGAPEYTVVNSFDAIKTTLDFDPWKIDGVYTVLEENFTNIQDDKYMVGTNVGYKFDTLNGEAEAYLWHKVDGAKNIFPNEIAPVAVGCERMWTSTYGLRGSFEPVANATLAAEAAYQAGRYSVSNVQSARSRKAYAIDLSGDYLFKDMKWTPKVGLEYITYSGEENDGIADGGTYHGWDPMYRGKFDTAIREFQNVYYLTAQRTLNAATTVVDNDSGATNECQIIGSLRVNPINNLTVDVGSAWFWFNEAPRVFGVADRNKYIGSELDVSLTYDYTEDVSFNLLSAWFFPGTYWLGAQDDIAADLVGTVKVAF